MINFETKLKIYFSFRLFYGSDCGLPRFKTFLRFIMGRFCSTLRSDQWTL